MSLQEPSKKAVTSPLGPNSALRAAWLAYLILLMLPFPVLAAFIISHSNAGTSLRPPHDVSLWLVVTVAYLVVSLPAALFYRRHLCMAYFRGNAVAPRRYLIGMLVVWLCLDLGVLLSLVGCYETSSFLPCLLPAITAFVVFLALWPNGRMMVARVGNSDDPEFYELAR
jgi:hypothetical protein